MKKIGILTLIGDNFGNRLQNYALQIILNQLGFKVETILESVQPKLLINLKYLIKSILKTSDLKFRNFNKNIIFSKNSIENLYINNTIPKKYDFFISGSDQVWNPYYSSYSKANFLTFAKSKQRISYAASFGVKEIPIEKVEDYTNWLSEFSNISVREEAGADIVEKLIGVRPEVVLDPTLLLTSSQWNEISKKPSFKLPKKYVLKYFLGNSSESLSKTEQYLIDRKGFTIFDVRSVNQFNKEFAIGPSEFVYLIQNADCIITDSFHGTVFSMIFKKPFVVFDRKDSEKDISSRIDSLCAKFDLDSHRNSNEKFTLEDIFSLNYEQVDEILTAEKEKSLSFLRKALNL